VYRLPVKALGELAGAVQEQNAAMQKVGSNDMSQKDETRFRIRVVKYLEKRYPDAMIQVNHGGAFSKRGRPDLECCIRGFHVAIELKEPGKKPTKIQYDYLDRLIKAGSWAFWADSMGRISLTMDGFDSTH
jgi:ABC-type transporter MlaC component